jgi:hypothetical protein
MSVTLGIDYKILKYKVVLTPHRSQGYLHEVIFDVTTWDGYPFYSFATVYFATPYFRAADQSKR